MALRITPSLEAVVFDMDGVVTDTARLHEAAWKDLFDPLLRARGEDPRPFTPDDYLRYVDGKPRLDGLRAFLASRGLEVPEGDPGDAADRDTLHGLAARKDADYLRRLREEGADVVEGTVRLVRRLQEGGYRTAVVSASRNAAEVLASAGLDRLFPVRVDGADAARLGLAGKPHPDVFVAAAERLATTPGKTAVVEDAQAGVEAGRRGGFALVVGLARGGEDGEEALREAGADVVLRDLGGVQVAPRDASPPDAVRHLPALLARAAGRDLVVFLDYDGTMTPIVDRPEDAILSASMREAVRRLAGHLPVAVVSGRDRSVVSELVGVEGVHYAGSHGMDLAGPDGVGETRGEAALPALDAAEGMLRERLAGIDGALVERKRFSVAAHYRLVAEAEVPRVEQAVEEALAATEGLRRGEGKKVFELRPDIDWHKGRAVEWILSALGREDAVPLYVGDDVTDEDAFQAVWGRGVGVAVMAEPRTTRAEFRLRGPGQVRAFVDELAAALERDRDLARRLEGVA